AGVARVRALADEGKWDQAALACEEALAADQLNPSVHFYQALVMEQLNRRDEAERALRRAIYLNRSFVLAHYHLALVQRALGRTDEAAQSWRSVRRLLSRLPAGESIPNADGLTVDDLRQLADVHLELL